MFNFWDYEAQLEIEGVLVGCIKNVGAFKKPVFTLKIDKVDFHIWGTAQINKALYNIKFGTKIKIKYLGKFKTPESRYPVLHFEIIELEV